MRGSKPLCRRSNTLRCLARGGTGCGHTLESLTKERRRFKDRKVPISQAKGQRKSVTLPVIVKVDNAGFQSYFLLEKPAFLFILLSWRETKKWI